MTRFQRSGRQAQQGLHCSAETDSEKFIFPVNVTKKLLSILCFLEVILSHMIVLLLMLHIKVEFLFS